MQIDHTQKISEIVIGLSKMVRTDVLMTSVVCDEYGNADPNGYVKDEYGDRG